MNRKVLAVVPILLIVAVFAFWPVYQEQQSGLSGKDEIDVTPAKPEDRSERRPPS